MSTPIDLLSPEQLRSRAKSRRERLSSVLSDDGQTPWPVAVEGWRGDRQVFGFAVQDSEQLPPAILFARSTLDADTVVVFTDARMFTYAPDDAEGPKIFERYQRGEVTLLDLAKQGDPRVIEQVTVLPYSAEKGVHDVQSLRYLTRYTFGRETGVIWDVDETGLKMADHEISGKIPSALDWAMRVTGVGVEGRPFLIADGGDLAWERLDREVLEGTAAFLDEVSRGRFVILNADPKIGAAAGLSASSRDG
jgi:hypothetical protein